MKLTEFEPKAETVVGVDVDVEVEVEVEIEVVVVIVVVVGFETEVTFPAEYNTEAPFGAEVVNEVRCELVIVLTSVEFLKRKINKN